MIKSNFSLKSLILIDVLVIISFWFMDFDILSVLLIYWFQNIVFGIANIFRIIKAKNITYRTGALGEKVEAISNMKGKLKFVFFFIVHYGAAHTILIFIMFKEFLDVSNPNYEFIILYSIVFMVMFLFSYLKKIPKDETASNVKLLFKPYLRFWPILIVFYFLQYDLSSKIIITFIFILKIVGDILGEYIEEKVWA